MALIQGIHHVALDCCGMAEYEKTVAFYRDVLGLPVARIWENGIMFDTGSGLIEIFHNATSKLPQRAVRHFALAADDVDACVEAVTKAGYTAHVGPKDIAIPSDPVFPARIAFCIGPVGEEIEFFREA